MFSRGKKKTEFESPFVNHKKGLKHDQAVAATLVFGALAVMLYFALVYVFNGNKGILLTGPVSSVVFIYLLPPLILLVVTIPLYKYFRAR